MKTLAIRQPWVSLIAEGDKTIEVRTWPTAHRGPLLLVASGRPLNVPMDDADSTIYALATGMQVCIVDLLDVRPLRSDDLVAACMDDVRPPFDVAGHFAWVLARPRDVAPTPHKGRLRLYDTPDASIRQA